ncbi:MAG TPA: hypothetical protein PLH61_10545 [Bacteroidia bacterium]|nr:hypothetical protein [Bacteroidia bacterium]
MNALLLITTIMLYIVALVGTFVLTVLSKKFSNGMLNIFIVIHLFLVVTAITTTLLMPSTEIGNYFMSIAFCSGLIIAGWAIRKSEKLVYRIYFGIYFSSVLLFLYSPSLLFYSISGNFANRRTEQQFRLEKNYFLIEQQSMLQLLSNVTAYKVSQKFGIYNRTIARDIRFDGRLDSVQLVALTEDTLILRGYLQAKKKK